MRVSLTGVVRSFGAHTVLDRVDLTLGPRSRLGLVGPNGAGTRVEVSRDRRVLEAVAPTRELGLPSQTGRSAE